MGTARTWFSSLLMKLMRSGGEQVNADIGTLLIYSSPSISVREPESKETWRATDAATLEEFKKSRFSKWPYGVGEAVKNCERLVRVSATSFHPFRSADAYIQYGLYDRPELETWHKGRILLVGDAAHPTSPVSLH